MAAPRKAKPKFEVKVIIKGEDVISLLVSAFEGGSNYWYARAEPRLRTSRSRTEADRFYQDCLKHGVRISLKQTPSYYLIVLPARFASALELMASAQPDHFANLIKGEADQSTGDIFLQFAIFRRLAYG